MNPVASKFIDLMSVAQDRCTSEVLGEMNHKRWEILFTYAKKQTLTGVVFPALDKVDGSNKAPLKIYARWALMNEKIRELNKIQIEHCRELTGIFADNGFRSCILKGQALASYYPDPLSRQSGDIDIWVDAPMDKLLEFLRSKWKVGVVVYHHCKVHFFDDAEVEVHFRPTWLNSFRYNRILQNWFHDIACAQFSNYDERLGFCKPTATFNAVMVLVHILRHLCDEGVGFRQVMDYAMVLENLDERERPVVLEIISEIKLTELCAALMYVLSIVFHTSEDKLLVAPDPVKGEFLVDEIIRSGNFGQADPRNSHSSSENITQRFFRKWCRALRLNSILGYEFICQPSYKLWQYLWRKKNRFS